MDDFPASAVGPKPPRPPLTVVVPVKNGGSDLERCLGRLRASSWQNYELIVVDDASSDDSIEIALRFGAKIIRHPVTTGPAGARNDGAVAASAPIVFFLDADVAIESNALGKAVKRLENKPELTAIFGSYDNAPPAPGLVSQFRNLLHHFVHQQGTFHNDSRPVHTFWTGIGAIRRDAFLASGGFDPKRYSRPAIEDIELGYRITKAGGSIEICRDIQGTHLKQWTLHGMIKTDILCRGVPWILLMKRTDIAETDLNVKQSQKLCVVFAALIGILAVASVVKPVAMLGIIACMCGIVALNHDFYRFLGSLKGVWFALGSVPLHLIYYYCCGLSVIAAEWVWQFGGLEKRAMNAMEPLDGRLRIDQGEESYPSRPTISPVPSESRRTRAR